MMPPMCSLPSDCVRRTSWVCRWVQPRRLNSASGIAVPIGWPLPQELLAYPRMLAVAQHWLGKAFVLAVVSLFAWHAAHRILCTLHDVGIHKGMVAKLACYGAALVITAVTSVSLIRIGF